jgi:hypothetical protein
MNRLKEAMLLLIANDGLDLPRFDGQFELLH